MHPRDAFLAAGALVGARHVHVLDARGSMYEPPQPPPPPVVEPDPLAEQLTRMEQSGLAARAVLMQVLPSLVEVSQAVQTVAEHQKEVLDGLVKVERAVAAPTESVPVYDKSGKMIGARRVKQGTLK